MTRCLKGSGQAPGTRREGKNSAATNGRRCPPSFASTGWEEVVLGEPSKIDSCGSEGGSRRTQML